MKERTDLVFRLRRHGWLVAVAALALVGLWLGLRGRLGDTSAPGGKGKDQAAIESARPSQAQGPIGLEAFVSGALTMPDLLVLEGLGGQAEALKELGITPAVYVVPLDTEPHVVVEATSEGPFPVQIDAHGQRCRALVGAVRVPLIAITVDGSLRKSFESVGAGWAERVVDDLKRFAEERRQEKPGPPEVPGGKPKGDDIEPAV